MRHILTAALLAGVAGIAGCDRIGCTNGRMTEQVSPDGQYKFVQFERTCGANTRGNLQISVLKARDAAPTGGGNIFIAEDTHDAVVGPVAQAHWIGAHGLRITYQARTQVMKKETKIGEVQVVYVTR